MRFDIFFRFDIVDIVLLLVVTYLFLFFTFVLLLIVTFNLCCF